MSQLVPPLRRLGPSAVPVLRSETRPSATIALEDRHLNRQLIEELLNSQLLLHDDWHGISDDEREWVIAAIEQSEVIDRLAHHRLLTEYQAARVKAGTVYGLVLGNYRILDRLGAGGMGIVFKAEHTLLRRIVALKVLPLSRDQDSRMLRRFQAEMRTIAALQHPNIVSATDAGQIFPSEPNLPVLHYLVMEYCQGRNLEEIVSREGPMDPSAACDLIHQVAAALAEANSRNLVHRDITPTNILVTALNQAKLLDFGLARGLGHQMTEPGSVLGTIDYMSPEQAHDASTADIRSDIYSLGATLFFCLTGKVPFPSQSTLSQQIARRMREAPPSVRARRPEMSVELDSVLTKMMALRVDDRYQTPQAVMRALTPFLRPDRLALQQAIGPASEAVWALADAEANITKNRVLIVDDDPNVVDFCRVALSDGTSEIESAASAAEALTAVESNPYDLILLDVVLPDKSGLDLLPILRDRPTCCNTRIILMSGFTPPEDLAQMHACGADDYLVKPFGAYQLRGRLQTVLRLNDAMKRIDVLSNHARALTHDLDRTVESRAHEQRLTRSALIQGLVSIYLHRTNRSPASLVRIQHYCRALAEEAATNSAFAGEITPEFIQTLEQLAPLYDIGSISLPDHILHKSGVLDPEERIIMQSHTSQGAELLQRMSETMGKSGEYLSVAAQLARHHHEQYNGKGYPDRLSGDQIPLATRILALADSYESLRTRRSYQPTLPHESACEVITDASPGKFDARLVEAFRRCAGRFDTVHLQISD